MNSLKLSAGLTFLRAAETGIAKSIGDRTRSATMNRLLLTAIQTKMVFDLDDAPRLSALGITSSVGVFRPLDESFYRQACLSGGTFARMWESTYGVRPFKAGLAGTRSEDIQSNIRVASNIAVLLVGDDTDPLMPHYDNKQVWWVTSTVKDEMEATVTLATGHKSKGLEWPAVQLGEDFMFDPLDPSSMEDPAKRDDELNLLYVVCTRAMEILALNSMVISIMQHAKMLREGRV